MWRERDRNYKINSWSRQIEGEKQERDKRSKRRWEIKEHWRRDTRREDGEEWWRRKKEKQAGGEMKRDKRWVRTQKIASMKESDKQTRQSVRAEKRRLGLDVLHQPPQALKKWLTSSYKNTHTSNNIRTQCNILWSEDWKKEEIWHREKKMEGGEKCGGRGAGRVGSRGGKQRPAYLMKQADEPN